MAAVSANWHFDKADYINNTPSRRDGISLAEERMTRKVGMKFLLNVSWNLKIPQSTIATAATYYHRFFMLRSFKKYHKYEIAGACILLACKTEETMRKISQVSSGCAKFARRDHSPYTKNEKEKEIEAWSKTIKKREPMIAATLCFDLSIKKPYQVLLDFLKSLEGVDKEVLQNFATNAWAIINDSYLTPMCLFHKPETIASAAIYLAAQMIDLQLNIDPSNGLLCWWEVTDCNVRELGICVQEILESYRIPRGEEMSPDVQENGNSISANISRTADNNLNGEAINSGSTTPLNMNHMTHVEIRNGVHTPYENSSPSSNTLMNGVTPAQDDEMEDGQIVEDDTGTTANGQLEEGDEMNLV